MIDAIAPTELIGRRGGLVSRPLWDTGGPKSDDVTRWTRPDDWRLERPVNPPDWRLERPVNPPDWRLERAEGA